MSDVSTSDQKLIAKLERIRAAALAFDEGVARWALATEDPNVSPHDQISAALAELTEVMTVRIAEIDTQQTVRVSQLVVGPLSASIAAMRSIIAEARTATIPEMRAG